MGNERDTWHLKAGYVREQYDLDEAKYVARSSATEEHPCRVRNTLTGETFTYTATVRETRKAVL